MHPVIVEDIMSIVKTSFNNEISAEGWLDNGMPMATVYGREDFFKDFEKHLKEFGKTKKFFAYNWSESREVFIGEFEHWTDACDAFKSMEIPNKEKEIWHFVGF